MIPILSRDQIRALDRHAVEACLVPGLVLMENAGRGAADLVESRLEGPGQVVVVCGPGNNGGDGFVIARRLSARGHDVRVFFTSTRERLSGDAAVNHDVWVGVGGTVESVATGDLSRLEAALAGARLVVDAVLGTGLDRPVSGEIAAVIDAINDAPGIRIAIDVPSGMDANTGLPMGAAVRADETVTFAHYKLGLVTSTGAAYAGKVTVVDIGIPASLASAVGESGRVLEASDVASWLPRRSVSAHKGSAGRIVAFAGSHGKSGAALLVARGALRAGAGLVTLCAFPETADALDQRVLEEMTSRIDEANLTGSIDAQLNSADAVVVGPGFGLDARARSVVEHVVLSHDGPVVVDADALTLYAGRLEGISLARGPRILTPHPGEMGKLLGTSTESVEADRFGAVQRAVELSRAVVLLKGARTLIGAPGFLPLVNPSGSPVLATAGSGDVLSGIVAALLPATGDALRAASAGAFVHGRAGELWAEIHGADRGLIAREIADGIPRVLAELVRGP